MVKMQDYWMDCEIRLLIQFLEVCVRVVYEVTISFPSQRDRIDLLEHYFEEVSSSLPLPFLSAVFPVSPSATVLLKYNDPTLLLGLPF